MFTTTSVAKLFGTTRQTIAIWCQEYAGFLSAGANPASGETRQLTRADLAVMAYIVEAKQMRMATQAIKVALAEGHRGKLPDVPDTAIEATNDATVAGLKDERDDLFRQNAELQGELKQANRQLERAEQRILDLQREIVRMEVNGAR